MNYWLHRISHEVEISLPLLESGFLTIGFSDVSNVAFLKKVGSAKGVSELDEDIRGAYEGNLLRQRHYLWRFLKEIRKGDRVLVPLPGKYQGKYSVYVITGEARLIAEVDLDKTNLKKIAHGNNGLLGTGDRPIDLGFYREVEFHRVKSIEAREISRYDYADRALVARMKFIGTNVDISDLRQNIENALQSYADKRSLTLHSKIIKLAQELHKEIYAQLTPDKFELLLKWYFERIGASNVRIPSKNERGRDGDADIVASFDRIRHTIYVQAKFHDPKSRTGEWAAEQIIRYGQSIKHEKISLDERNTSALWVVSTCKDFTKECKKKAEGCEVVLITGLEFARMLLGAGIESLEV